MNIYRSLADGFGRKVTYLRISVTDRCNLRCVYCMPEEGVKLVSHADVLSYEDILRLVNILSVHGISKIRITGGEPLVRKGITRFIKDLSGIKGVNDIAMTTNGLLLEPFAAELFDAGLKRVNISLDSLKEDVFLRITRLGRLNDVLNGIYRAKEVGFYPVKVNAVLIRNINDGEIIDFVNFARAHEFNLRFIEYMPVGLNAGETVTSKEVEDRIKEAFSGFMPLNDKSDGNLSVNASVSKDFTFSDNKAVIGFISPLSKHFCEGCSRLRLTASGKLRTCLFYDNEYDIKKLLDENNENTAGNDDIIFKYIEDALKQKKQTHLFNEKAENFKNRICSGDIDTGWANDYMNKIGG